MNWAFVDDVILLCAVTPSDWKEDTQLQPPASDSLCASDWPSLQLLHDVAMAQKNEMNSIQTFHTHKKVHDKKKGGEKKGNTLVELNKNLTMTTLFDAESRANVQQGQT